VDTPPKLDPSSFNTVPARRIGENTLLTQSQRKAPPGANGRRISLEAKKGKKEKMED